MRVLVTGGTGFLGCHTVAAVARAGHRVRLLVRSPESVARSLEPLGLGAVEHVVGDVTDPASVAKALDGCQAVVHAAAVFSLSRSRAREIESVNLRGAENVLGEASRCDLDPIVHVSSLSALFPPDGERLGPGTRVKRPTLPYSRSKAEAERFARDLQERGAPVAITYPGGAWGPCDPYGGEGMAVVMRFLKLGFAPCPASGGFPMVDVRDVASVHAALLEPGRGPRRYMAGGRLLRVAEVFDLLGRATGRRFLRVPTPGGLLRGAGLAGDWLARLTGLDPLLSHEAMRTLTEMVPSDDSRTEAELGVRWRSAEETVRDTLTWMFERGLLSARHVGRLARADGRSGP